MMQAAVECQLLANNALACDRGTACACFDKLCQQLLPVGMRATDKPLLFAEPCQVSSTKH
jgi:hypothetical protein